MAALPLHRTTPDRPFRMTSVDYAGPVGLASKIGRNPTITKAYIAVFVCCVTRAIHLELVTNASTSQFIAAFRRFTARCGQVAEMWSDNGPNFKGADRFLKEIYNNTENIAGELRLKWNFIPPNSPHHGGLHEAAVKSVKHHLKRVIGTNNLTFEEYNTLLTQVEACVNSRPLTPLTDDPNDLTALTPAHFLVGESLITLREPAPLLGAKRHALTRL